VIVRSAVVSGYVALAVAVGIGDGIQGLEVLAFYYVWAGAWVAFMLVWGWVARGAGSWNYARLMEGAPAGREPLGRGPRGGEPEPEQRAAAVDRSPLAAAAARRRRAAPVV
jgi:hypothetical protein